ncbi:unnamed protein product [Spirodela intermedia]|uniref:Uncharacterized protein n=1 Tax=Spirodela intermedia TaxID=51605 RepID=A0A7I8KVG0_SPIIN|nr:unnamed protein product [Spirodela intermedia]
MWPTPATPPHHAVPPSDSALTQPRQSKPYVTYGGDYPYQQAMYNPQIGPQYYAQMYGPSSWAGVVGPPYQYAPTAGYSMQTSPRAGFSSPGRPAHQMQGPPYVQYQAAPPPAEASSVTAAAATRPLAFQLQSPPRTRQQPSNMAGKLGVFIQNLLIFWKN